MFSASRIDVSGSHYRLLSTNITKFSARARGSNLFKRKMVPSLATVDNVWRDTSLLLCKFVNVGICWCKGCVVFLELFTKSELEYLPTFFHLMKFDIYDFLGPL